MMPFNIFGMWFRSLLAVAIVVGAAHFLTKAYKFSLVDEPVVVNRNAEAPGYDPKVPQPSGATGVIHHQVFRWYPQWNDANKALAAGLFFTLWAVLGRFIRSGIATVVLRFSKKSRSSAASPGDERNDDPKTYRQGEPHEIARPDGSKLRVESYGSKSNPAIIWCHGWGQNSTEWFYQKLNLAHRFRVIVWDEPGLGLSTKPTNNNFRLENFANDLAAVVQFCGDDKVYLAGHSIGGMTILTFCKLFPELLRMRVAGLILAHTTYTNPVRTTKFAPLYTAIEKPLIVPLLYLMIFTWPLVWLMNWMSYLNGSTQQSTHKSSFAGTETLGQLNFVSLNQTLSRPDVLARGMLGMLKYDATAVLARIGVPTLVIVGDKDKTTLPEAGRFIADTVPLARLETLTPARHHGLMEHHGWFDHLVKEFVGGIQQGA